MAPFSFSQALKFCPGPILAGHIFAFLYILYFVVEQLKAYIYGIVENINGLEAQGTVLYHHSSYLIPNIFFECLHGR